MLGLMAAVHLTLSWHFSNLRYSLELSVMELRQLSDRKPVLLRLY